MSITSELNKILKSDPVKYGIFYYRNEALIHEFIAKKNGIKSDLYYENFEPELNNIRFATVFSDLTNLFPAGIGSETSIIIPHDVERKITLPLHFFNKIVRENNMPLIHAGYIVRPAAQLSIMQKMLEPLLEQQKVILHNSKMVLGRVDEPNNGQVINWELYDVSVNSPIQHWLTLETAEYNKSFPINFKGSYNSNKTELFEVTVPYLEGISFKELAKILVDYEELLASFRYELRQLIKKCKEDGKDIDEIKNDVIRPIIDKIGKAFNDIQNIHKLKVYGTTFATVTVSLIAYYSEGISQLLSAAVGSGGFGLFFKNEVDYRKEIQKLSDQPLFLMWQIKNISRK